MPLQGADLRINDNGGSYASTAVVAVKGGGVSLTVSGSTISGHQCASSIQTNGIDIGPIYSRFVVDGTIFRCVGAAVVTSGTVKDGIITSNIYSGIFNSKPIAITSSNGSTIKVTD